MTIHTLHDHKYSFYVLNPNMPAQINFIIHDPLISTFDSQKLIKKVLYH